MKSPTNNGCNVIGTKQVNVVEGYGTLNFKTEWQSLDGRCCHKWHGIYDDAMRHAAHLLSLGRKPQVWAMVKLEDT